MSYDNLRSSSASSHNASPTLLRGERELMSKRQASSSTSPRILSLMSRLQLNVTIWVALVTVICFLIHPSMRVSSLKRHVLPPFPYGGEHPAKHRDANIAYFLQITNSSTHLLPRLMAAIHHPSNIYVIHFDTKCQPDVIESIFEELERRRPAYKANTHILPAQAVSYAGISMVLNTLAAMSYLMEHHSGWDFFVNLSGSDYPLVKQDLMRNLLGTTLNRARIPLFMNPNRKGVGTKRFRQRAELIHLDSALTGGKEGPKPTSTSWKNPFLDNLQYEPVYGSAWMMVPYKFVKYAVDSDASRRMLLSMAYMRAADEHFFVSLAYNHNFYNASILPSAQRRVYWDFKGMRATQHPHEVDLVDGNGNYIFKEDLLKRPTFFARKFRQADSELMKLLDIRAEERECIDKVRENFQKLLAAGRIGTPMQGWEDDPRW